MSTTIKELGKDRIIVRQRELPAQVHKEFMKLQDFLNSQPDTLRARVRRIYKFVDKYMVLTGVPSEAPCKKGCSACCHIPVDITAAEAVHISDTYSIPVQFDPTRILGLEKSVERIEQDFDKHDQSPCPFLKNDLCQIYDERPLACRTYFSVESTPELCGIEGAKLNYHALTSQKGFLSLIGYLLGLPKLNETGHIEHYFGIEQIDIKQLS